MAEVDRTAASPEPAARTHPAEPAEGTTPSAPARPRSRGALFKLGVLVLLIIAGYLVATRTPLGGYLSREGIFELVNWLRGHPWAPVIFIALYATATALAVPGTILTLGGGAIFGFWWGTLFNFTAANIGANAAFVIARALGRDGVRHLMGNDSGALEKLDNVVKRHGLRGLLTLRLIPLVPFNALNFGSGLMPLRWRTYALATLIGILPGTAVYTFFADALLQGSQEASRDALIRVAAAGLLLILLSFLPALLKRLGVRLPGMGAAVLVAALASGFAGTGHAAAQTTAGGALPDHRAFTAVLAPIVGVPPLVDYARLAADRSALDAYIAALDATDPTDLSAASPDAQLAFWINAYNACMLKRVADHYPIRRAGGLRRITNAVAGRPANSVWQIADVFTGDHCPVAGSVRSQDEIEHEIIRPMGDPRIHFAINCAALSCPPLIPEAYDASTLDAQLDARVHAFVNDPRQFTVAAEGGRRTVRVNIVLDWFKEDFGGLAGIRPFLARYTPGSDAEALEDPNTGLEFIDYDWTLNDTSR